MRSPSRCEIKVVSDVVSSLIIDDWFFEGRPKSLNIAPVVTGAAADFLPLRDLVFLLLEGVVGVLELILEATTELTLQ